MMIMRIPKTFTLCIFLVFLLGITLVACGTTPVKKRSLMSMGGNEPDQRSQPPDQKPRPSKRTFCNAFTGCGKKRSDASIPMKDYEYDQHGSLVDNSDDSIDDVARDILAEARLWEALQARSSIRGSYRQQGFFPRNKRSMNKENSAPIAAAPK